jgi:hypothetical protein
MMNKVVSKKKKIPSGDKIFRILKTGMGSTQPTTQWVQVISRGQSGRGVVLTTQPHLASRLKKE